MTVRALKKKNNMSVPFKMKGNPMQRNFGISPVKKDFKTKAKAALEGVKATVRASATENLSTSVMHGKQAYRKAMEEANKKKNKK